MSENTKQQVLDLLNKDAKQIEQLITNQKNFLCLAHCKAFEEVVDTQMYGFSKEVDFAIRLGAIDETTGHELVSHLEQRLNNLYTQVYENEEQQSEEGESGK